MNLTSAQFRTDNKVLFRAPIIHSTGLVTAGTKYGGGGAYLGGAGDYLDLNHDNQANFQSSGGGWGANRTATFTEPNLSIPMETLRNAAKAGDHGEVLTQDVLRAENLQDVQLSWGRGGNTENHLNQRSLGTLVERFAPLDLDTAKYAIDLTANEFVIYRPNT